MNAANNPRTMYRPTSANAVPADRRRSSSEGTIGGPCHATTASGYFCRNAAVMVAPDTYGYCRRHAPR